MLPVVRWRLRFFSAGVSPGEGKQPLECKRHPVRDPRFLLFGPKLRPREGRGARQAARESLVYAIFFYFFRRCMRRTHTHTHTHMRTHKHTQQETHAPTQTQSPLHNPPLTLAPFMVFISGYFLSGSEGHVFAHQPHHHQTQQSTSAFKSKWWTQI